MESNIYRIQKLFAVSFVLDVFLLCVLFALSFLIGGSSLERIVLTIFLVPALGASYELWSRKILLDDKGLRLEKFLRKKEFKWPEITHVGAFVLRSRAYLLLTTVKGLVIISNAYENFPQLIERIVERIDHEKIDEEVRQQMNSPLSSRSEIFKSWVAAAVLLLLIILKVFY
jgi:hypothetical protein